MFDFDMLLNFIVVYKFIVIDIEDSYISYVCCWQLMEIRPIVLYLSIIIIMIIIGFIFLRERRLSFDLFPFFVHKVVF